MKTDVEVTKNETIQELYLKLDNKANFIRKAAKAFDKRPGTLKNHWFSCFFSVPQVFEDRVIEMLNEAVAIQTTEDNI